MAAILDKFPKLRVCAAHLGGFRQWKYALDVLADRNVWMDTSSCMQEIDALQRRTRFTDSELDELLMNGSTMLFG